MKVKYHRTSERHYLFGHHLLWQQQLILHGRYEEEKRNIANVIERENPGCVLYFFVFVELGRSFAKLSWILSFSFPHKNESDHESE